MSLSMILRILLNWPKQKLYKFYFDLYAKFEDLVFDNFHSVETLTNETYPISCFLNLNGGSGDKYFIFSFVKGKYRIYHSIVDGARGL